MKTWTVLCARQHDAYARLTVEADDYAAAILKADDMLDADDGSIDWSDPNDDEGDESRVIEAEPRQD